MGGDDDPIYGKLEIHYDNPNYLDYEPDDSGVRLHITNKLRKYDAQALRVGHSVSPFQIIPPGSKNFLTVGVCLETCLNQVKHSYRNILSINNKYIGI